eukprot:m.606598 g.606598  ORF g.606598 m.606598 type:complete len:729 (+) comp22471_c0_seq4:1-2187(+)
MHTSTIMTVKLNHSKICRLLFVVQSIAHIPRSLSKMKFHSFGEGAISSLYLDHALVKIRPDTLHCPERFLGHSGECGIGDPLILYSARNEYESFQLVANGGSTGLTVSDIVVHIQSPSSQSAGRSIQSTIHREHYINITTVSNCDGEFGLWPDALVPTKDVFYNETRNALPATAPINGNQAFWIDLFVPPDHDSGKFDGSVQVTLLAGRHDGETTQSIPFSINVFNFSLSSTSKTFSTTFNCPLRNILDGKYYDEGVPPDNISRSEKVLLQRLYLELGLMHRLTTSDFLDSDGDDETSPLAQDPPQWDVIESHWGPYLHAPGAPLPFGFSDARVTTVQLPAMHFGERTTQTINRSLIDSMWHSTGCGNPAPTWGYTYWWHLPDLGASDMLQYCKNSLTGKSNPWSKACGSVINHVCTLQHPPLPPLNNTAAVRFWKSAAAEIASQGWTAHVFDYTCDEPAANPGRYAACRDRALALHSARVPSIHAMITTEKASADAVNMSSLIDTWCPIINFMDSSKTLCPSYPSWAWGNHRADYDDAVAAGKGLWWYQSCMSEGCASTPAVPGAGCAPSATCTQGTWPSYMIDVDAVFNRAMSWVSFQYSMFGELYWGTNAADRVYSKATNTSSWETQYLAGGNGDGSLTYPGRPSVIGGQHFVPIASVRLKQIRDGYEDLEYMYLLTTLSNRSVVRDITDSVVRTAYNFSHNASSFLAARIKLAVAIEKELHSSY